MGAVVSSGPAAPFRFIEGLFCDGQLLLLQVDIHFSKFDVLPVSFTQTAFLTK
jgi:hypothetical protein